MVITHQHSVRSDEVSKKSGFDVYVSDLFNGDTIPWSFMKVMPGDKTSIGARVSRKY